MAGSTYGKLFSVTTWGESHGDSLGVVIDGCPSGINLCEQDIQIDLDRRKPATLKYSSKRAELDRVNIVSGVFEGRTTGTPITAIIENIDHHSKDYSDIESLYRPGHADFSYDQKFGFRDYRGGGRSSGRETVSRVVAGAIARKILSELNIHIYAYTKSVGNIAVPEVILQERFENPLVMPNNKTALEASLLIEKYMEQNDSCGAVVECVVTGLKSGIGQPVFEKLDAELAKAMISIGGVKGVEFGRGFESAILKGSQNNDAFCLDEHGRIAKDTNNSGGILGGISDGSDIIFRLAFKPTPSIGKYQKTVTKDSELVDITIQGRHDPIIAPRAVIVVEAMAAIVIVDLLFANLLSQMANIKKVYF